MDDCAWQESQGKNVFEMIDEHGGPGLWVRRLTWATICARIVAVGEMTGAAPYFGNPSVLMDVYTLDGRLKDELEAMPVPGTYKTWRRWPEPEWASSARLRSLDDPAIAPALYALNKKRQKLPGMQHGGRKKTANATTNEPDRTYLNVPYAEKDEAKKIGARWEPAKRSWWLATSNKDALQQAQERGWFQPS